MKREIKRKVVEDLNSRLARCFYRYPKFRQKDVKDGILEDGGNAHMVFADGSIRWGLCVPSHSKPWVAVEEKSGGYSKRDKCNYVRITFVELDEQPIGYVLNKDRL